jgi:hypothetical protein
MSAKHLLQKVAADGGFATTMEMLEHYAIDSVVPGICIICGGIDDSIEPDREDACCDECGTDTVKSVLVIAGVI